jgi:hypothetical protein
MKTVGIHGDKTGDLQWRINEALEEMEKNPDQVRTILWLMGGLWRNDFKEDDRVIINASPGVKFVSPAHPYFNPPPGITGNDLFCYMGMSNRQVGDVPPGMWSYLSCSLHSFPEYDLMQVIADDYWTMASMSPAEDQPGGFMPDIVPFEMYAELYGWAYCSLSDHLLRKKPDEEA